MAPAEIAAAGSPNRTKYSSRRITLKPAKLQSSEVHREALAPNAANAIPTLDAKIANAQATATELRLGAHSRLWVSTCGLNPVQLAGTWSMFLAVLFRMARDMKPGLEIVYWIIAGGGAAVVIRER
ncbi:hypothetical protein [Agreia sp. Leaf244]|uniref:hypothetical protein n=1 Tax=Agreia sp. Leaf244 TaxID=1736305 RepID=UPI0012F8AC37|nr:hypothetical protein [Agreia sp. Leaf244]